MILRSSSSSSPSPLSRIPPPVCRINSEGLSAIVSSFENSIQSCQSLNDLEESTCSTLLKEIGISESKIEQIESKLFAEGASDSLKSKMMEWSETVSVEQIIEDLEGAVDTEEASRLALSLEMISKGLNIIRPPHWLTKKCNTHIFETEETHQTHPKSLLEISATFQDQEQECAQIMSLMDDAEVFSKDPEGKQEMIKHMMQKSISSIQLLMGYEELAHGFPIKVNTRNQMKKLLKTQRESILAEVEMKIQQRESSHGLEDSELCLFFPITSSPPTSASSSGSLLLSPQTRMKYLSIPMGISESDLKERELRMKEQENAADQSCASFPDSELIFKKVQALVFEIDNLLLGEGDENSCTLYSASKEEPNGWANMDQFLFSIFEEKGKARPQGLGSFREYFTITELHLQHSSIKVLPQEIGHLKNLQMLNLQHNLLQSIPPEIGQLVNLQSLNLEHNQLKCIPSEIGNLTNLKSLHLYQNRLLSIPLEISQLSALQRLILQGNQIQYVPCEMCNLSNLQILNLHSNQLQQVPPEIGQLISLQTLHLEQNELQSVPREIGQLTNLQTLNLQQNQLRSIPSEIGNLMNLQILQLDHNQLDSIPSQIGQLTNLQTLNLLQNRFLSTPPEIGQLTNLQRLPLNRSSLYNSSKFVNPQIRTLDSPIRYPSRPKEFRSPETVVNTPSSSAVSEKWIKLNQFFYSIFEAKKMSRPNGLETFYECIRVTELKLSNAFIKYVPCEIGQLINLQVLDLSNNLLNFFPSQIGQLTNLQTFNLQQNQLRSIPSEIGNLMNLQILQLDHNQLDSIPSQIGQLTNLQTLNLHKNQLQFIPEIGNLINLQNLTLGWNKLQSIPSEIGQLTNLQLLLLNCNQLRHFPSEIGQLSRLLKLHFWGAQLQSIPPEIGNLINLQNLKLSENQFQTLPPEFSQLTNLQTLNIECNPNLREEFKSRNHPIYSNMFKLRSFFALDESQYRTPFPIVL